MNLKIAKFVLFAALFCSAIFAAVVISPNSFSVHPMTGNRIDHTRNENTAVLRVNDDSLVERHPIRFCGDSVGDGHP